MESDDYIWLCVDVINRSFIFKKSASDYHFNKSEHAAVSFLPLNFWQSFTYSNYIAFPFHLIKLHKFMCSIGRVNENVFS